MKKIFRSAITVIIILWSLTILFLIGAGLIHTAMTTPIESLNVGMVIGLIIGMFLHFIPWGIVTCILLLIRWVVK